MRRQGTYLEALGNDFSSLEEEFPLAALASSCSLPLDVWCESAMRCFEQPFCANEEKP